MKNEIRFKLEPRQRPKLAQEIGNILGTAPNYERVPSCAYDIAGYRLDKEGVLRIPEGVEAESVENLQKIIANKQTLFQRAFWTESTEIEITEEKINFAWFPYTEDGDKITVYTQFITRLCDMAKDAKRVLAQAAVNTLILYLEMLPKITKSYTS